LGNFDQANTWRKQDASQSRCGNTQETAATGGLISVWRFDGDGMGSGRHGLEFTWTKDGALGASAWLVRALGLLAWHSKQSIVTAAYKWQLWQKFPASALTLWLP
jgi:hypothetical protein